MGNGIFVTGTDTGVGKTHVTCLLVRAFRAMGIDAVGMKPFACGDRSDGEALYAANDGVVEMGLVNPVWLRVSASPYAASLVENRTLDIATAAEACRFLRAKHSLVVVEGVGGWRVPLTDRICMSQFAGELAMPVVVVVANRIGALNHTRLTVDAIRSGGLSLAAILWNDVSGGAADAASITNRSVFEQLMPDEFQAEVAFGSEVLPGGIVAKVLQRAGVASRERREGKADTRRLG
jgi:dethiobiotin synthetase